MKRFHLWFLMLLCGLAAFIGCGDGGNGDLGDDDDSASVGDDDDDDDTTATDDDDDDDDDTVPTAITVVATWPVDGEADHNASDPLWIEFSAAPKSAAFSVASAAGDVVAGATSWVGDLRQVFTPDPGALIFSTDYVATVSFPDGLAAEEVVHVWSFSTNDVGTPTGLDPAGTFQWDLTSGTAISPAAGGDQLVGAIGGNTMFTEITESAIGGDDDDSAGSGGGSNLLALGALGIKGAVPGEQDLCTPTFDLTADNPATWNDPHFQVGPADVQQVVAVPNLGDVPVTLHDMVFAGDFVGDGADITAIEAGMISFYIDAREIPIPGGDPCTLLPAFVPGFTCGPCPDGQDMCVNVQIVDLSAVPVDLDIVERTQAEIDADTSCP